MDFNIEIRKKQLENLDQFISSSRSKLQLFMDQFGWTADQIVEERQYVTCPYNNSHKLLPDKPEEHIEKCKLKIAGYDLKEEFLSEPFPCIEERRIQLDGLKKIEVLSHAITQIPYFQTELFLPQSTKTQLFAMLISAFQAWNGQDPEPQTFSRLITTFSKDERLALYNYCVSNTKGPEMVPEFDTSLGPEREKNALFTDEALMSFERDIKRRSVKYKPIHTNHKNYKEILKEVISSQMHQYEDWLIEKKHCKGPHTPEDHYKKEEYEDKNKSEDLEKVLEVSERPYSSISRISNHSSSSRSTVKQRDRYVKYSPHGSRSNSKERKKTHYNKEDFSHIKYCISSKYEQNDEDSRGSNISKLSSSHKSDHAYDEGDIMGDNSRDSSVHSSYKHKKRRDNYFHSNRKRSREYSNDRERKKHHRKHRSRSSHRSEEYKYDRDKLHEHRSRRYTKNESR